MSRGIDKCPLGYKNHTYLKITGLDKMMKQIMFVFDVPAPTIFPVPCLRHFFVYPFKKCLLNDNNVSETVLGDEDK